MTVCSRIVSKLYTLLQLLYYKVRRLCGELGTWTHRCSFVCWLGYTDFTQICFNHSLTRPLIRFWLCQSTCPHLTTQSMVEQGLQIDNCNSGSYNGTNESRFQQWTDALTQVKSDTGTMMFYSLWVYRYYPIYASTHRKYSVEWQSFDAWTWGPSIANSWRIYDDIQSNWPRITAILNNASFIGNYSGFWGHNDLGTLESNCHIWALSSNLPCFCHLVDMLENGNGDLTLAEQRSHFTAWALAKSPLLIGTDVSDGCCLGS